MKTLNSIIQTMIMLTALVAFLIVENDVRGQCYGTCGTPVFQTFSHIDNGTSDCNSIATGGCSFTAGTNNQSQGASSAAFNSNNIARGDNSFVIGDANTAEGLQSFVGGQNSSTGPLATNTFAYGDNVSVTAANSTAFGVGLTQNGANSFLGGEGFTNNVNNNFIIGWQSLNPTPVMYADLNGPFGTGFLGLNRVAVVNGAVDIDLSVAGNAEKGAGGTTWINPSDKRLKKDILPFEDGLEVLMKFDPVSFLYNGKMGLNSDRREIGIIAQEVKEYAPYMIYGEEGEDSYLSYSSNALFYILVNSVQEQQEIIVNQEDKIKEYETRISDLETQMDKILNARSSSDADISKNGSVKEVSISNISIKEPMLFQNEPNPFSGSTSIRYYVPENVTNAEVIIISTENGQIIKRISIDQNGMGMINLNVENVASGSYTYALILDGTEKLSKKMVIGR